MDLNTLLVSQNNPVTLNVKGLVLDGVDQTPRYFYASLTNPNICPIALQTDIKWNVSQDGGNYFQYNPATGIIFVNNRGRYICTVSLNVNNATGGVVSVKGAFKANGGLEVNPITLATYASSNTCLTNVYIIDVLGQASPLSYFVEPSSGVVAQGGTISIVYLSPI